LAPRPTLVHTTWHCVALAAPLPSHPFSSWCLTTCSHSLSPASHSCHCLCDPPHSSHSGAILNSVTGGALGAGPIASNIAAAARDTQLPYNVAKAGIEAVGPVVNAGAVRVVAPPSLPAAAASVPAVGWTCCCCCCCCHCTLGVCYLSDSPTAASLNTHCATLAPACAPGSFPARRRWLARPSTLVPAWSSLAQ
jgi:hypothetical protein